MFGFYVPFLIAYHLNGYKFIVLVVQTFQDLPKGAFPNHFKHLKPVANVVVQHLEKQEHCEYLSRLHYDALYAFTEIKVSATNSKIHFMNKSKH